jgi:hypothetical protein
MLRPSRGSERLAPKPGRRSSPTTLVLAACHEKADEVDDLSGYLGMFGGSLFAR